MNDNYQSDNLKKYYSKNKLKTAMINNFNNNFLKILHRQINNIENNNFTLLDIGCGEGFIADLILNQFPEVNYNGIDNNVEAIKFAQNRISPKLFNLGNIYDIDSDDNNYSFTLCLEVLEHLVKPDTALYEVLRVTKYFSIVSVPNEPFFSLGNLLSLKNVSTFGDPPDHLNHWTFFSFRKFIAKNGFRVRELTSSFPWSIAVISKD